MTANNSHAQVLAADSHEPKAHAASHESGGSDEIDVTGLVGAGGGAALVADAKVQLTGANYTTSSGTPADVDATNLSSTITTGAHRVKVTLTGGMGIGTSNAILFDIHVDGASQGTVNGVWQFRPNSYGIVTVTQVWVSNVLTAASHTIKLRWSVNGDTGTLYRNAFYPLVWLVEELPV